MAQVLIIDDNTKQLVKQLKGFAEKHPFTLTELQQMLVGKAPFVGDREGYSCELPIGISVTYSVEEHPNGVLNHLSVSVRNRLPSPALTEQVVELFEFVNPLSHCYIYVEPGTGTAMNIMEPAAGNKMPHGVFME